MTQRRVLVTGASRGIGRAIAIDLARAGFHVTLNFRSGEDKAREVQDAIEGAGGSADLLGFDVSDREATAAALEPYVKEHGGFWGVVINAGVTADKPMAMLSGEEWDRVLRTNLDGFFNVVRPLVMPMVRLRDGGRVVGISSVSGMVGNAGQTNYAASKGGLIVAVRSLAAELARRDITCNCVAPGFVKTDMVEGLDEDAIKAQVPLRRMGEPEEIAAAVTFLFSDGAAYVTGATIPVTGGLA